MISNVSREHSPSSYSAPIDVKHRAAAFRGASHAFSNAPLSTKVLPNTYSGTNGALAAASSAGLGRRREKSSPGGASLDRPPANKPSIKIIKTAGPGVPGRQTSQFREQSPSHVAALLATSRATPRREVSTSSKPSSRRPSPLQSIEDLTDSSPVNQTISADTSSLVKLFESKQPQKAPVTHSVRYVNKHPPSIASPTPIGPLKRSTTSASVSLRTLPAAQGRERRNMTCERLSHVGAAAGAAKSSGPSAPVGTSLKAPVLMKSIPRFRPEALAPSHTGKGPSLDGSHDRAEASVASNKALTGLILDNVATDLRSRPGRSTGRPALPTRRSEPVAVPLAPPSTTVSRPSPPSYLTIDKQISDPVRLGRKTTRSSDSYVPQLTVDSLANAMVASSLASSRAPSPIKPPPLPPPRRHAKHSLFHHPSQEESRTPSPAKGMRQTMREPLKSDEEDGFRKHRSHRVRKHPNKHHEGDRKRYRNEVTERERKRYEGVWAANKGLLDANTSTAVINIVVRDIWKRSRLPDDVLEEVWNLVDTQGLGKLEREEFVVGLFLIDQRLKGNKLPFRVSDSIWSSVRRLSGINVPRNRR